MKLSFSNLAWTKTEDLEISGILSSHGVVGVDFAMGRYFDKPYEAPVHEWQEVANRWRKKGFEVAGMQSLLFGAGNANIFASIEDREFLLKVLGAIFIRAEVIGAKRLVFGSPRNRLRLAHDESELEIAVDFFQFASTLAQTRGVSLLIEPNSKRHGCNFLNSTTEAIAFCKTVGSDSFAVNLDLGAEADSPSLYQVSEEDYKFFGHLHLSESDLAPLRRGNHFAGIPGELVRQFEYLTVEQLGNPGGGNGVDVQKSAQIAREFLE